jgi:hypothetical protein
VAVVALDQDVAAQRQAALAQRHGEMAGAVVQVVDGRRVHGNATLVHLGENKQKRKIKVVKWRKREYNVGIWLFFCFFFTLKKARQPPLDWKAGMPTTVT